jgi:chromosome segregation ATPase
MELLEQDKRNFGGVLTAQVSLTANLETQLQDLRKDVTTRADALEQCQTDITSRVGALEKFQSETLTVRTVHDQALTDFDGRIGRCVTDLASLSKKLDDAQAQLQTDLDKFAAKDALDALEGKITGLETIPTQISALEVQLAAVREEAKKNHDSFEAYQVVASTRFALKDVVDFLAVSIDQLGNSASSAPPSAATGTIPVGIVATNVSHVNTMEKLTQVEAELTRISPAVQRLNTLVDSHEEKQKKLDGFFQQTLDTVESNGKVTLNRLIWAEKRQTQALTEIYSCLGSTFDVKNHTVIEARMKPALEQIGTIKNQIGTIQAFLAPHLADFTVDSTNAPSLDQILGGITTNTVEIRAQVDRVERTISGFTAMANLVAGSTDPEDAA